MELFSFRSRTQETIKDIKVLTQFYTNRPFTEDTYLPSGDFELDFRVDFGVGFWSWILELDFGVGFWSWTFELDLRIGPSSWIFELDFRVGFSSWTFELDFRVGFSSWIFELEFRVGFSSWIFEFEFVNELDRNNINGTRKYLQFGTREYSRVNVLNSIYKRK